MVTREERDLTDAGKLNGASRGEGGGRSPHGTLRGGGDGGGGGDAAAVADESRGPRPSRRLPRVPAMV